MWYSDWHACQYTHSLTSTYILTTMLPCLIVCCLLLCSPPQSKVIVQNWILHFKFCLSMLYEKTVLSVRIFFCVLMLNFLSGRDAAVVIAFPALLDVYRECTHLSDTVQVSAFSCRIQSNVALMTIILSWAAVVNFFIQFVDKPAVATAALLCLLLF